MSNKNALEIVREMTAKIKTATSGKVAINEKRYQYSKDECENIFNNVYKAIEEYTTKDPSEGAYETLLNSLYDRFKVSPTGGNVSIQVDSLSDANALFENQVKFQDLLDNAKDIVIFITDKAGKIPGTKIVSATPEKEIETKPEEKESTSAK